MQSSTFLATGLFFLAWMVPGLFANDPWKPDEAYTFSHVMEYPNAHPDRVAYGWAAVRLRHGEAAWRPDGHCEEIREGGRSGRNDDRFVLFQRRP